MKVKSKIIFGVALLFFVLIPVVSKIFTKQPIKSEIKSESIIAIPTPTEEYIPIPENVSAGTILSNQSTVVEKQTNSYSFTIIKTLYVNREDGGTYIYDKDNNIVCQGKPCCDESMKNEPTAWQKEWCTEYPGN